ncbi:unnamed protein product [Closterium sp. NIES-53]
MFGRVPLTRCLAMRRGAYDNWVVRTIVTPDGVKEVIEISRSLHNYSPCPGHLLINIFGLPYHPVSPSTPSILSSPSHFHPFPFLKCLTPLSPLLKTPLSCPLPPSPTPVSLCPSHSCNSPSSPSPRSLSSPHLLLRVLLI